MMSPRKPEKFEEMREKSKKTIISAAIKVFSEYGYQATIDMIAKEAGISKGLIYNYFKSKDELLEAIFMSGFTFFNDIISTNEEDISAIDKLDMLLGNLTNSLKKNLKFWKLYQSIMSHPMVSKKLTKFNEFYESVFGPLLFSIFFELYGESKIETEIKIEVLIFAALMDGIAFDFTVIGEEYPIDKITESIIQKYKTLTH